MPAAIVINRLLPARCARVFEAWTRGDLMARWFFPDPAWRARIDVDLRVGGAYRIEMVEPDGHTHVQFGHYREIEPVSRLVFTWTCPDVGVRDSIVTIELRDRGEETELVLTHELPPDPEVRQRHEAGWRGCLGNLQTMLSAGGGPKGGTRA